eukprot:1986848-Amphidinium_carterae.1
MEAETDARDNLMVENRILTRRLMRTRQNFEENNRLLACTTLPTWSDDAPLYWQKTVQEAFWLHIQELERLQDIITLDVWE